MYSIISRKTKEFIYWTISILFYPYTRCIMSVLINIGSTKQESKYNQIWWWYVKNLKELIVLICMVILLTPFYWHHFINFLYIIIKNINITILNTTNHNLKLSTFLDIRWLMVLVWCLLCIFKDYVYLVYNIYIIDWSRTLKPYQPTYAYRLNHLLKL